MSKGNNPHIRINPNTKCQLMNWKRELSAIENRDIPIRELIDRMTRGEDILFRLKSGSIEKRTGRKIL